MKASSCPGNGCHEPVVYRIFGLMHGGLLWRSLWASRVPGRVAARGCLRRLHRTMIPRFGEYRRQVGRLGGGGRSPQQRRRYFLKWTTAFPLERSRRDRLGLARYENGGPAFGPSRTTSASLRIVCLGLLCGRYTTSVLATCASSHPCQLRISLSRGHQRARDRISRSFMELAGLEPATSWVRSRRSPS